MVWKFTTRTRVTASIAIEMLYSLMSFPQVMSSQVPKVLSEWYNPNTCSYRSEKNSRHSNN
jgi:hypothetical protein